MHEILQPIGRARLRSIGDVCDGRHQDAVFFFQNAFAQAFFGVLRENGNGGLRQDCSSVQRLVHEVDGAARNFYPMLQGLSLGMQPSKRGEQGGMDVDDPSREPLNEGRAQDSHEPSQDDQLHAALLQNRRDRL